jgi:ferredoxin-like protein FixX
MKKCKSFFLVVFSISIDLICLFLFLFLISFQSNVCSLNQYSEEQKNTLVDSCPTKVYGYNENTQSVFINDAQACIFCKECLFTTEEMRKNPEDKLGVDVKHSADKFYFTVETTGSLTAKEVVMTAVKQLSEKITRIQKLLPKYLQSDF